MSKRSDAKLTRKANVTRSHVSKLTSELARETLGRKQSVSATTNELAKKRRTIRWNDFVVTTKGRIALVGEQIEPGMVFYDDFIAEYYLTLGRFYDQDYRMCWRLLVLSTGEETEQLERMLVEDPDVEWLCDA